MRRLHPAVLPLIATVSWGTNAVAGRVLVGGGYIDGVSLTLVRFALATPLVFAAAVMLGERVRGRPRDVALAGALGLLGVAGFNVFFYSALGRMEAALVSLVTSTITPMTYLASVALGMDRLDARGALGLALAAAGVYLVLSPQAGSQVDLLGAALAFAAAVSWTLYSLAVKGVSERMGPTAALAWSSLAGTLALAPAVPGALRAEYTPLTAALIVYVAVVPGALGYAAWNLGVRMAGPSLPAFFIPMVPLTAAVLGWLLLGEELTALQILGGAMVVASIAVVSTRKSSG